MLIEHLPADSALARAVHGAEAEWSLTDHLLATVVDHLAIANWMFATVNGDPDGEQPPYPEPVPRPGEEEPAEKHTSPAEIIAFLNTP